jgi:trehalose/maltose transport system substrate-binding protein
MEGSYNPTIQALYRDPEVLEAAPIFRGFEHVFANLVLRPSAQTGAAYMRISEQYWDAVYDILNGHEAEERLREAEESMKRILDQN